MRPWCLTIDTELRNKTKMTSLSKLISWVFIFCLSAIAVLAIAVSVWVLIERAQANDAIDTSVIGQKIIATEEKPISRRASKVLDIQYWLSASHRSSDSNSLIRRLVVDTLMGCDGNIPGSTHWLASDISREMKKTQTIEGAIDRAFIACQLSRRFDQKILGVVWLNRAYYGRGTYSLEDAVTEVFGGDVDELTDHQAAMIVAILAFPNSRNNEEQLHKRTEYILEKISNNGQ